MKYKLINKPNNTLTAIEQILVNRGIPLEEIPNYLNPTDDVINDYFSFGEKKMKVAGELLKAVIDEKMSIFLPVDCDMDGYTSAALFLNYLYDQNPDYTLNYITWWHHEGKQHGLQDCIEEAKQYDLVICLDAASNDYEEHRILREMGTPVICCDHHEAEKVSDDAIIINNQLSNYPNKAFSGVGVTWQFCRYLDDNVFHSNYANKYLDLVASGLCGDMMSLKSIETKYLIHKGFKDENLKNPFLYYMAQKNAYSLGDHITPMGAAFYIVPFVNAIVRSGTKEEKDLIFRSMLSYEAFKIIPSTKRGCKGQTEKLVEQAIRTAVNVKARQTREQDKAVELLEKRIQSNNMMDHSVLLFLLNQGEIASGLAGLVANKMMAKYQRPCCILTLTEKDGKTSFSGSARGYSKSGVESFKDICESLGEGVIEYAQGHANAFGLSLPIDSIDTFIEKSDKALATVETEPLYYVDFEWGPNHIDKQIILEIGSVGQDLWGQEIDEPYVAITNLAVNKNQVSIFRKKDNTIKITTGTGVDLMLFKATEAQCELFSNNEVVIITLIGRCNKNEWMGRVTPQIFIEDYQVETIKKYDF